MSLFDILTLIGGLSLFLFGMTLMGNALEKRAGNSLKLLLGKLTTGRAAGFLTGIAVTAVIQSSSATTVMVVGFVNSGLMTLRQAINVIMGANVGTTVTAWILSLSGISGTSIWVQLLKPSSFTPILALIGIVLYMAGKGSKQKDTGLILLGFSTLMFGMETMSGAVAGLKDIPAFGNILLAFSNPVLGVIAGAILTAIIQSSSASVGILQALATTGQVTFGSAIPIIMGQNIGTCVTAMLSSVGANKNARRAAVVHLSFNIIGTVVWLSVFCLVRVLIPLPFIGKPIDQAGIAIVHSAFNLLCTALLLPMSSLLEKLACRLIPESRHADSTAELDDRLLATPAIAIDRSRRLTEEMAREAAQALNDSIQALDGYTPALADGIRKSEDHADHYEDILGTYLVRIGPYASAASDSKEDSLLLHIIGDLERISDHAVNILESAEELHEKGISFSAPARRELTVITGAVKEIVSLTVYAFTENDLEAAARVEPLEQVVDTLKEQLRSRHILRLQRGECSIEAGFILSDLLTDLERVSDHCSNIAGSIIEMTHGSLQLHGYLDSVKKGSADFLKKYDEYAQKYALVESSVPEQEGEITHEGNTKQTD